MRLEEDSLRRCVYDLIEKLNQSQYLLLINPHRLSTLMQEDYKWFGEAWNRHKRPDGGLSVVPWIFDLKLYNNQYVQSTRLS